MTEYRVATHPKKGSGVGECFYLGTDPCKAWDVYRKISAREMLREKRITTLFRRDRFDWEPVARQEP
jgi:hypothetical protein